MRVYFTDDAEADLEEIADYIALDNPRRAVTFAMELRKRALAIGGAPRATRARPDMGPDLRAAIHSSYPIIYRIAQKRVEVLRVIHGARDFEKVVKRG